MLLYFEFEGQRHKANVSWPKNDDNITVHLTDKELVSDFPADLLYTVNESKKVEFEIEDPANERLLDLQTVIKRRLQEFATKE
jgi:hypothetical protein